MNIDVICSSVLSQKQKSDPLTLLPCASVLVITVMTLMPKVIVIRAATVQIPILPYNRTADCTSRECQPQEVNQQHLLQMQRYMNSTADPCENFHEYACGNWRKMHVNGTTTMRLADERVTQRFANLFESWLQQSTAKATASQSHETPTTAGEEVREKLLKYYKVCKALEDSGGGGSGFSGGGGGGDGSGGDAAADTGGSVDKSLHLLSGYITQMHEENLWRLQDFQWSQLIGELGRYGYSSHFLQHFPSIHNVTYMQLFVEPHDVDESMQWNAEIAAILKEFSPERDIEQLKRVLFQFEHQVVSLVRTTDDTMEEQEYTAQELLAYTGTLIDWHSYLGNILGRKILSTDKILVQNLHDIREIALLLQRTDPKIILLYTLARFLNYLQQLHEVSNFLATTSNSYRCIKHMRKNLYLPMNYIYELNYYANVRTESDAIILDVFDKLKNEFSNILRENAMKFSETELQWLQLKLQEVRINIGNIPVNVTSQFYSDYVQNLNFSDNFYYNHLHALQHYYSHLSFLISLPDSDLNSPMRSFNLNNPMFTDNIDSTPFFNCRSNMIYVPYAYLQLPYFSAQFRDTLLYGDLANTLGHELIHGFEPTYLLYDAYGAAAPTFQASLTSNEIFHSNLECMNESTQLLGERIADVSGTQLAIRTFLQDPVFRRNNGRLFFLQFAQFFCGSTEEEIFRAQDPNHDIDNMRLNYVVAQMPEFAEVFACARGSALNPTKRCHMW